MKYQLQVRNKNIENDIYDNEIFASEYEDNNQKIQAIENILANSERLKKENNKFMNGEIFSAKQVKFNEEQREKYFIHKSKAEQLQTKANKYDVLVEELKEHIKDWYEGNYVYGSDKFIKHLQKLISKENKQC